MPTWIVRLTTMACLLVATAAAAHAEVCLAIDTAHDTFSPSDQAAALLLVTRQFEQEGERVVPAGCARPYTLSHIRLGDTIVVHISGGEGQREAVAHGMEDLPALYSQMARSIVTGRPMTGFNVVDRTNVTASQATARRFHTDSLWYARLGYGSLFGNDAYRYPGIGIRLPRGARFVCHRCIVPEFSIQREQFFLIFRRDGADVAQAIGSLFPESAGESVRIPRRGIELWASELRRVVQPCDRVLHLELGRQRYARGIDRWIRARARYELQGVHAGRRRASFLRINRGDVSDESREGNRRCTDHRPPPRPFARRVDRSRPVTSAIRHGGSLKLAVPFDEPPR